MINIYKKNIKNKEFFYLSEQVRIKNKYKKIQVYLGKNIPNDLSSFYGQLAQKEEVLVLDNLEKIFTTDPAIAQKQIEKVEKTRIQQKYYYAQLSDAQKNLFWKKFAIAFIFQSNAIEGSKLSQDEVVKIINNKYIKKSWNPKEVIEVQNAIEAFAFIQNGDFKLNQKSIKKLHAIITKNLDIEPGYKKRKIIVNNKETIAPDQVRENIKRLIENYKAQKKEKHHPFFMALKFHADFEFIHPFVDGNGRTGRIILIWMLMQHHYGVILFRTQNRRKYFNSLDLADKNQMTKFYWFAVETYQKTLSNLNI